MVIYGTALLAFCMLVGLVIGQLLGIALGVGKNVGGVGIAMLLLIVLSDWLRRRDRLPVPTQQGVLFWSSIYIPIVVAMAASQNVVKAASGGWLALVAGVASRRWLLPPGAAPRRPRLPAALPASTIGW